MHHLLLEIMDSPGGLRFAVTDLASPALSYQETVRLSPDVINSLVRDYQAVLSDAADSAGAVSDSGSAVRGVSANLETFLLPTEIKRTLSAARDPDVLIRTDLPQVPWELMQLGVSPLGLTIPVGRAIVTSRPTWAPPDVVPLRKLHVLVVADPNGDLPGATAEADALVALADQNPFIAVDVLRGDSATLRNLVACWRGGCYHVLHFAGHTRFQYESTRSLIALADGVHDASHVAHVIGQDSPRLVFLNSCNSGYMTAQAALYHDLSGIGVGMLRVGTSALVTAHWPVADGAGEQIAVDFYSHVVAGASLGDALLNARERAFNRGLSAAWAGYSLIGSPSTRLLEDPSSRIAPIQSGGAVAAQSTIDEAYTVHVCSIHSYLLSAATTNTVALSYACECRDSEALVSKAGIVLQPERGERIRVGLPGRTGCSVYLLKYLASCGYASDQIELVDLDSSRVLSALTTDFVDVTAVWEPSLSRLDPAEFTIHPQLSSHAYTVCVLVGRKPRNALEEAKAISAVQRFRICCQAWVTETRKWQPLLAEQLREAPSTISSAQRAYDFQIGALARDDPAASRARAFVAQELEYLKNLEWAKPVSDTDGFHDLKQYDSSERVHVAVQQSVSSAPLVLGRFLGLFS